MSRPDRVFYEILLFSLFFLLPVIAFAQPRGGGGGGRRSGSAMMSSLLSLNEAVSETRSHISAVGGVLEPGVSVEHAPPITGIVDWIFVSEGQRVTAGETLFRLRRDSDTQGVFQNVLVTARVSGIVARINIVREQKVSTSMAAVRIIDTSTLHLTGVVSDKDAFALSIGDQVTATTADGKKVVGTLFKRSVEPDYTTFLFEVTFRFEPDGQNPLGRYLLVNIPVNEKTGIFVNREAVQRRYGEEYLWVVSAEKTVELRKVISGENYDDDVEIVEGLNPGEQYLTGDTLSGIVEGTPLNEIIQSSSRTPA